MKRKVFLGICVMGVLVLAWPASGGFPQWRGPLRNGIVPGSTALVAAWGEGGPAKLWTSEPVPLGKMGGMGSVVVSGGKVYLFASIRVDRPRKERSFEPETLDKLGWTDREVPDGLAEKIETARTSEELAKLKGDAKKKWIASWIARHVPDAEQRKRLDRHIETRLKLGDKTLPWRVVKLLAGKEGELFDSESSVRAWLEREGVSEQADAVLTYATTESRDVTDTLLCVDLATGRTLWKREDTGCLNTWGSSATPLVDDGKVYYPGSAGRVHCLRAEDGEHVWSQGVMDLPSDANDLKVNTALNGSMVSAGDVVLATTPQLTALDARTGVVCWSQSRTSSRDASPVVVEMGGRTMALLCTGRSLACVDVADGSVRWNVPASGRSTPTVVGDIATILTDKDDGLGLVAYRIGADEAERLWSIKGIASRGASAIIHDGHVYAFGKPKSVCVAVETGKVRWEKRLRFGGYSSPVLADGKILVNFGRYMGMVAAEPGACRVLADKGLTLYRRSLDSPALVDGRVLLRSEEGIVCYDLRAGKETAATGR
jgi:outer membrane protein assembly factor BamB